MVVKRISNDELYHHGTKGQKWGVRRYQNPDGSLTEAGRKRYSTSGTMKKSVIAGGALGTAAYGAYGAGMAVLALSTGLVSPVVAGSLLAHYAVSGAIAGMSLGSLSGLAIAEGKRTAARNKGIKMPDDKDFKSPSQMEYAFNKKYGTKDVMSSQNETNEHEWDKKYLK